MSWVIDQSHSLIEFSAKHMMFTTVRGRFTKFDGSLDLNEKHPEKSYVEGTVDLSSVDTHDRDRDTHLRSPDFFDVEKYPTMTFRSKRIQTVDQNHFKVIGDLTIKDVTQEITFDVTNEGAGKDPWGNKRLGLSAKAKLNRKDFGLNWNVALEAGGWLVGEEVKIAIELQAIQKQATPEQEALEAVPA